MTSIGGRVAGLRLTSADANPLLAILWVSGWYTTVLLLSMHTPCSPCLDTRGDDRQPIAYDGLAQTGPTERVAHTFCHQPTRGRYQSIVRPTYEWSGGVSDYPRSGTVTMRYRSFLTGELAVVECRIQAEPTAGLWYPIGLLTCGERARWWRGSRGRSSR